MFFYCVNIGIIHHKNCKYQDLLMLCSTFYHQQHPVMKFF